MQDSGAGIEDVEVVEGDLEKIHTDILSILIEKARPGIRVLDELEEQWETDIPHGRVYNHLDNLADMGLVEKDEHAVSKRTHLYKPTPAGFDLYRGFFLAHEGRFGEYVG